MASGRRRNVSLKRHLELAADNEQAFKDLRGARQPAHYWAGTALFYSAVHLVDALLRQSGTAEPSSHEERWQLLVHEVDDEFIEHYLALKDLSQDWRYYGVETTLAQLDLAHLGHYRPLATVVRASTS